MARWVCWSCQLLLCIVLSACSPQAEKGAASASSSSIHGPSRIISLLPAATEIILALDAADRLVARTSSELLDSGLPDVGDPLAPNLELIAAVRPELLIAWQQVDLGAIRGAVEASGEVLPLTIATLADLRQAIEQLAGILELERGGEALLAKLQTDLSRARQVGSVAGKPTVAWVVWHAPVTLAGPGSFMDETLTIAGGVNVVLPGEGAWPTIGFETLLDRDPDIIVWPDGGGVPGPEQAPGTWTALGAFRDGAIVMIPAAEYQVPGPSIGESAAELAHRFVALSRVTR